MKRSQTRRNFLLSGVGAAVLGLSGCSGEGDSDRARTATTRSFGLTEPLTGTRNTDKPTETNPSTETEEGWTVDPVEHDGLVGAYYYQWYHGEGGYGLHDERPWLEHVPDEPMLGQYHSRDPDVINQHIKWALDHGINWFMAHGAAPDDFDEITLRDHVMEAELADRMQFSLIAGIPNRFHEDGLFDMDDPELRRTVAERLATYERTYFDRDNYLTVDNAPLVMYYSIGNLTGDVSGAWEEIRGVLDGEVYLVADPNMGSSPGSTGFDTPAWELAEAFDAFTEYNMNSLLQLRYGTFDRADLQRQYRDWRIAAEDYDVEFIPMTLPGEDHSEIKWKEPRDFHLERTPERFRRVCRDALTYRDPELDAVLITSFNEWPEYTSVEPAESYGTTYLEIVEEELALDQQDPLQVGDYIPFVLDFNRSVPEQEVNPSAPSNRPLTLQLGTITLLNEDGTTFTEYDVGVRDAEPAFTRGVYSPLQNPDSALGTSRWLGGPDALTRVYLDPSADAAAHVILTSRPISDDITAQVHYDGENVGQVEFDDGVSDYLITID